MIINNLLTMDSFNIESVKINRRKSTGGRYITDFIFYFTNQTSMELSCYNEEKHIDVRLGDPND
tara:strand:- start:252 stop:443 length:192 start_codon:yes stop_codon:yes gene_type:complete